MPQIKEYQSQVNAAGPVGGRGARGEDFGAGIGAAAGQLGEGLSNLGEGIRKHQATVDISNVNAQMAEAGTQWTQEFQNRLKAAPAGDTTFVDTFQKDYDTAMDKLGENVQTKEGQAHFDQLRNSQKAHFMDSAIHGQAELVKEKVILDHRSFVSNLQNQLIMDPTSYQYVMNTYKAALDALPDQRQRAKFDEEETPLLEKSKVYGDIRVNPEQAKADLEAGRYDKLKGTEVEAMIGHANSYISGQRADRERQDRLDEKKKKDAEVKTQGDFLRKLEDDQLTAKDVLSSNLTPFGSGSQAQFLNLLKDKGQKALKDNSQFVPLFQQVMRPDGDPQKLTDERKLVGFVGNGLTIDGYHSLLKTMQGGDTTSGKAEKQMLDTFVANAKRSMSKSNDLLRIQDVQGDKNFEDWLVDFLPNYHEKRSNGKSPQQLLSSKGDSYLGANITVRKGTDVIRSNIDYANKASSNPVTPLVPKDKNKQWKPGDSVSEVLERNKK